MPAKKRKIDRKSASRSRQSTADRASELSGLAAAAQPLNEYKPNSPTVPIDALTPMPDPELGSRVRGQPIPAPIYGLSPLLLSRRPSRVGYQSVHVHVTDAFKQIEERASNWPIGQKKDIALTWMQAIAFENAWIDKMLWPCSRWHQDA